MSYEKWGSKVTIGGVEDVLEEVEERESGRRG